MNESNIRRAQIELIKAQTKELSALQTEIAELKEENRLAWAVVEKFLKKYGSAVVRKDDFEKKDFNITIGHNLSGEVLLRWTDRSTPGI